MDSRAEDIRRQMENVRAAAGVEVESIVQSAKTLSDWRYYVKNHPLLLASAAAGIGFMLIPRKKPAQTKAADDAKELIELLKKHHVSGVTVDAPPSGFVKTAIGLATPFLLRSVMNFAQNRVATTDWGSLFGGAKSSAAEADADGVEQSFEEFNIPR
jgi:hypothetical protein